MADVQQPSTGTCVSGGSEQENQSIRPSSLQRSGPADAKSSASYQHMSNGVGLPKLRGEETAVPPEAINYKPTPDEVYKPVGNGAFVRLIFGDLPLTPYELGEVTKVKEALKNEPNMFVDTVFSDDRYVVRFLQGNNWDVEKCITDMRRHLVWRSTNLPVSVATVTPHLSKGFCYVFGRDKCLRPIFIIRCKEFINAEPESVLPVVLFWMETMIHKLLVKNRVEQWRVIIDLDQCSAFSTPAFILKEIADTLTRNYRGRLSQMLIIKSSFVFWGMWQLVSVVLPERTKQKICLYTSNFQNDLFSHVNKNQVEERYGGTCPNVKEFDGIFMPPGPFS
ncbi:polyphosphoinositide binding protein, putative [Toxoplasma gondii ME49]|uniref:CRAL-TRIO domain-containing protein C3H8.02 n=16 Tax=Toxoplasma gondii TaxID=5811 RepID=B9PVW9_TOXGV|nr:polyphosphoinositide binding protein, putative [Toxoplasma gondii ME49]EPR60260.1 putative polyphosphoinositide binding protein [Toxoplasma gondii GT1]ESS31000.1 putative polyphosphoinositide binding protein [Toxoplasma gondii VEG]KAF4640168.1 putative polyphosphoinositide binding protein [Toxoplasma gondii]KFG31754.1 putative polyphosphoinositide binding protein [Toxoplasma gondii GAB2-2007-GAL-DOM2]KFG36686.1 putative polyphosphoinositide binding protein [Toxoplasma gondii p89]KFG44100.1|eukprot:XP_002369052.1 polyphosphoinositide binding protein, putative [Toxoplasma gondii ME49]